MLIGTTNHKSCQMIFIYNYKYPQSYWTLKYNHIWQWEVKKSFSEQQAPEIMRNNFALINRDTFYVTSNA
jgi:hypothetical protein